MGGLCAIGVVAIDAIPPLVGWNLRECGIDDAAAANGVFVLLPAMIPKKEGAGIGTCFAGGTS